MHKITGFMLYKVLTTCILCAATMKAAPRIIVQQYHCDKNIHALAHAATLGSVVQLLEKQYYLYIRHQCPPKIIISCPIYS